MNRPIETIPGLLEVILIDLDRALRFGKGDNTTYVSAAPDERGMLSVYQNGSLVGNFAPGCWTAWQYIEPDDAKPIGADSAPTSESVERQTSTSPLLGMGYGPGDNTTPMPANLGVTERGPWLLRNRAGHYYATPDSVCHDWVADPNAALIVTDREGVRRDSGEEWVLLRDALLEWDLRDPADS